MASPRFPLLAAVLLVLLAGCGRAPKVEACAGLLAYDPATAGDKARSAFESDQPQFLAVRESGRAHTPGVTEPAADAPSVIAEGSQAAACPEAYYRAYAYAQRYNEALLSELAFRSVEPGP